MLLNRPGAAQNLPVFGVLGELRVQGSGFRV